MHGPSCLPPGVFPPAAGAVPRRSRALRSRSDRTDHTLARFEDDPRRPCIARVPGVGHRTQEPRHGTDNAVVGLVVALGAWLIVKASVTGLGAATGGQFCRACFI